MIISSEIHTDGSREESLAELLDDGLFIDGDWIETKDQDPRGEVRLVQLADIGDGIFRDRSARFLTMKRAKELRCTFLKQGDILVARMPDPLGRACIFPGVGRQAVTAVDVCILRPNRRRARSEWLVKAINTPAFRQSMQAFVRGTTRQRISRKNLGTLKLRVPPIEAQLELAEFIDRFELVRGGAASHVTAASKAAERLRLALLAAACSGRLTADWRSSQALDDEATSPVGIPGTWKLTTLGELTTSIRGGSNEVPSSLRSEFPILRSSSVRPFRIDYGDVRFLTEAQSGRDDNFLQRGDLLITRLSGSIEYVGNCAVVRDLDDRRIQYPDRLFCCRLRDPAEARYLEIYFAGPAIRRQIQDASRSGAGHQRISIADLKSFTMALPPAAEQLEIVRRVDRLLALASGLRQRIDVASARLERSSQAVLDKAFREELALLDAADDVS